MAKTQWSFGHSECSRVIYTSKSTDISVISWQWTRSTKANDILILAVLPKRHQATDLCLQARWDRGPDLKSTCTCQTGSGFSDTCIYPQMRTTLAGWNCCLYSILSFYVYIAMDKEEQGIIFHISSEYHILWVLVISTPTSKHTKEKNDPLVISKALL